MILEIAELTVEPGNEAAFFANVAAGVALFRRAKGCHGMTLLHSPEAPGRYRLLVRWQAVENHTVDFRGSEDFVGWRRLTASYFAAPPVIVNWSIAVEGFGFQGG
jgi:heme-degrading monooxygenase HmoA